MYNLSLLLENKVVILIGGAGLLGREFAKALVVSGATVIIADIDLACAEEVCKDITNQEQQILGKLYAELVDITSRPSLQNLITRVKDRFQQIDAVVNNAYPRNKNYGRRLEFVEYHDFCENVNLHLGGYFLSMQSFAEFFKTQNHGHVVNISSIYGCIAPRFDIYEGTSMTMPVEYAAIKSAIQHLTSYFMRYYKSTPLRFNCISPGGILDKQPTLFLEKYNSYAQSKGMLDVSDISGSLIFLISDLSNYINGQNIIVDDGFSQ